MAAITWDTQVALTTFNSSAIAIDDAARMAYIPGTVNSSTTSTGLVTKFNLATMSVVTVLNLTKNQPGSACIDTTRGFLYVATLDSAWIAKIDLSTFTVSAYFQVYSAVSSPITSLCFDATNNILYAVVIRDNLHLYVFKVDASGVMSNISNLQLHATDTQAAGAAVIDATAGILWVTSDQGRIFRLPLSTFSTFTSASIAGANEPGAMVYDGTYLYASDISESVPFQIAKIDPTTLAVVASASFTPTTFDPNLATPRGNGLVYDSIGGKLYAEVSTSFRSIDAVMEVDPSDLSQTAIVSTGAELGGFPGHTFYVPIAIDPAGTYGYVASGDPNDDNTNHDWFGRFFTDAELPPTTTSTVNTVNTFGHPGYGFSLIEPRPIREARRQYRRHYIPELDLANSYYSMVGRWPDVGWLLIARKDYDQIDPYATDLQLVLCDFVNPPLVLNNLAIVQARCVTRGLASDENAIYLVQVTNPQGVLFNPWFQFPTTSQYNVRAPAYDGSYYADTMNGAAAWTWDEMVGDLWNQAITILGVYPGLPIVPSGTPENWTFVGVSIWEAINRVLDHLGLTVAGDNAQYTIVVPGADDATYDAIAAQSPLEDSMEYIDEGSGRVPKEIVVYFHRRNAVYGTEETVRKDTLQWQGVPVYSVTVATAFVDAVGTAYIWSDFSVRYDMDGSPLAADVTTANTIAAELATELINNIHSGTKGDMRDVYSGLIAFSTGSMVDGVRWYNTGLHPDDYAGWRTEIIRGFMWPEVVFPPTARGLVGPT